MYGCFLTGAAQARLPRWGRNRLTTRRATIGGLDSEPLFGGADLSEKWQGPSKRKVTRHVLHLLSLRACEVPPGRRVRASPASPACFYFSSLTGMNVPLAAGVFGSVTTSTPFLKVAVTLLPSTAIGSRTLRRNAPYVRSTRW